MCHNIRRQAYLALAALTVCVPLWAADEDTAADEEALDRTPQKCITTSRIRETDVIDDRTIVFWMRGGGVYSNILDRDCPGLGKNKRFMHETRGGRLCDIDTVTVLEQWAGQLSSGFTCRLGAFLPISEAEAQDLVIGPDEALARRSSVEVKEVELPPEDHAPTDAADTQSDD